MRLFICIVVCLFAQWLVGFVCLLVRLFVFFVCSFDHQLSIKSCDMKIPSLIEGGYQ